MPDKMFLKKNAVCDIIDVYVNTEVKACFKRNRLEHHRVVLRDMFTGEEALKLKETEQYEKDKHLRQAVDYVLDKVAIK